MAKKRTYKRKSYYSKLGKKPTTRQASYLRCKRRGGSSFTCYKRAQRVDKPWYFYKRPLGNDTVTSVLPKPGYIKVMLPGTRYVRYLKDTTENRTAHPPGPLGPWAVIEFNPTTYAAAHLAAVTAAASGGGGLTPSSAGSVPSSAGYASGMFLYDFL